jgi:ribonuclease P protein component
MPGEPIAKIARGSRLKAIGHLKKADEISSVFDFKSRISTEHFVALGKPNQLEMPRVVVMVGKKTHKHAVRRNYMRRVCQEYCRIEQATLGSMDIVIRVIKPFLKQNFSKITQEIATVIGGLSKCRDS